MKDINRFCVKIVTAPKVQDFEERLNALLAEVPADSIATIDYLFEPTTYGLMAMVRMLAEDLD